MKRLIFILTLIVGLMCCRQNTGNNKSDKSSGALNKADTTLAGFAAEPGFKFPETENTINGWLKNSDDASIYAHGWGIWQMVTAPVTSGADKLTYQQWPTPANVIGATAPGPNLKLFTKPTDNIGHPDFHIPRQLFTENEKSNKALVKSFTANPDEAIFEDVRYNPALAAFIADNGLLKKSVLNAMFQQHKKSVPDFPSDAISLKPVYKIISPTQTTDGFYTLNVWPGPPANPVAFPESKWNTTVFVDLNNNSAGNGSVAVNGGARTPQNSYNLSNFIHFKIDKQSAAGIGAKEGDIALLVGMHVTSREIVRWTWQTFWWTPAPDNAPSPSSSTIISSRPATLKGAPAHYAMSSTYTFINPDKPLTGGDNIGTSIYCYNPYIEAGFAPFANPAVVVTNGVPVNNNIGVRTNCMSCHAYAVFPSNFHFVGNTYVDMNDPFFNNKLKTDFSYSLLRAK